MKNQHDSMSPRKRLLFRLLTVLIPFLLLGSAEMVLRLVSAEEVDPYIDLSPVQIFERLGPDQDFFRIKDQFAYEGQNNYFSVHKPADTIRIFCVGGSACAGWPLPAMQNFAMYLQDSLELVLPGQRVEVINVAIHGFASYRVRSMFEELLEFNPSAIVVYSGNNEFLEQRRYTTYSVKGLVGYATKLKTVNWLRSRFGGLRSEISGEEINGLARTFFKKAQQQALESRSDPGQFEQVKMHYSYSMKRMSSAAGEKGIPVLLCTVPVNLRDWLPLVSHNQLTGDAFTEWQKFYKTGIRGCLINTDKEGSIASMAQAIELEPQHAESCFWMGRLFESSNRGKALEFYQRACDLDYNPFRAISHFNNSLRSIANETADVYLVDLAAAFTRAAKNGAPGFDLFLDYVHPNTQGHLLIAEEIFSTMAKYGLLSLTPNNVPPRIKARSGNGAPYDARQDGMVMYRMLKLYIYNHQRQAALGLTEHLYAAATGRELTPDAPMPAEWSQELIEGYEVLKGYETQYRRWIIGENENSSAMEAAKARVDAYYDKYFPFGTF